MAHPCSSQFSTGATGTRGAPVSGLESGNRSLPATAAGRCRALAIGLREHLASDPREFEGSHVQPLDPGASQKLSLSTLKHLYHLGISWESFLFVGYLLLLAHGFFPPCI